jgi:hypothetical protein
MAQESFRIENAAGKPGNEIYEISSCMTHRQPGNIFFLSVMTKNMAFSVGWSGKKTARPDAAGFRCVGMQFGCLLSAVIGGFVSVGNFDFP